MVDEDNRNSDSLAEDNLEDNQDVDEFDKELGDDDDSSKENKKTAQARIDELTGRLKEKEKELEAEKARQAQPAAPTQTTTQAPDPKSQQAIEYLESLGFARKETVDEKIKTVQDRVALEGEHSRLSGNYDGSDGRPKYDKTKVEGYMRDHAVYDPEVAYKAMNEAELLDWHVKQANAGTKKRPYVERPGGSATTRNADSQITKEKLAEVAANPSPANREWYERNRNKILQLMAEGQL